ncbi:hypothetical protein M153_193230003, partial [Pseudoloma neurophilia]
IRLSKWNLFCFVCFSFCEGYNILHFSMCYFASTTKTFKIFLYIKKIFFITFYVYRLSRYRLLLEE